MPLQNIHPDLKLGLVLVAALLKFVDSNGLLAFVVAERLTISSGFFGGLAPPSGWTGGIGGLAVVGAAIGEGDPAGTRGTKEVQDAKEEKVGSPGRIRTCDLAVNSRPLYR